MPALHKLISQMRLCMQLVQDGLQIKVIVAGSASHLLPPSKLILLSPNLNPSNGSHAYIASPSAMGSGYSANCRIWLRITNSPSRNIALSQLSRSVAIISTPLMQDPIAYKWPSMQCIYRLFQGSKSILQLQPTHAHPHAHAARRRHCHGNGINVAWPGSFPS
jgi:hypothetical protein